MEFYFFNQVIFYMQISNGFDSSASPYIRSNYRQSRQQAKLINNDIYGQIIFLLQLLHKSSVEHGIFSSQYEKKILSGMRTPSIAGTDPFSIFRLFLATYAH